MISVTNKHNEEPNFYTNIINKLVEKQAQSPLNLKLRITLIQVLVTDQNNRWRRACHQVLWKERVPGRNEGDARVLQVQEVRACLWGSEVRQDPPCLLLLQAQTLLQWDQEAAQPHHRAQFLLIPLILIRIQHCLTRSPSLQDSAWTNNEFQVLAVDHRSNVPYVQERVKSLGGSGQLPQVQWEVQVRHATSSLVLMGKNQEDFEGNVQGHCDG